MKHVARVILAASLVAAAACKGKDSGAAGTETGAGAAPAAPAPVEEFKVSNVMIGKRIGENKMVTEPTFQFAPADTIYASVGTTGKSDGTTLTAVWKFQTGQTVDSSSQSITPTGPANTEFHISRPKGWPVGTYQVTVFADGDSVDAKNFVVKK
jgi:hypothetical protein